MPLLNVSLVAWESWQTERFSCPLKTLVHYFFLGKKELSSSVPFLLIQVFPGKSLTLPFCPCGVTLQTISDRKTHAFKWCRTSKAALSAMHPSQWECAPRDSEWIRWKGKNNSTKLQFKNKWQPVIWKKKTTLTADFSVTQELVVPPATFFKEQVECRAGFSSEEIKTFCCLPHSRKIKRLSVLPKYFWFKIRGICPNFLPFVW